MKFAQQIVDMHPDMIAQKSGLPPDPEIVPDALTTFLAWQDDDPAQWPTANLGQVFSYLRKSKHLHIPKNWAPYIPKSIWSPNVNQKRYSHHFFP